MKLFIALLTFMFSSMGYANCMITSNYDHELRRVIYDNKGWDIESEKYNKICNRLKAANLGVEFTQMAMISQSASVASTNIVFFPIEIKDKYGKRVLTSTGYSSMSTDEIRATTTLDALRYATANRVLLNIIGDENSWKEILDQAAFVRKYIK